MQLRVGGGCQDIMLMAVNDQMRNFHTGQGYFFTKTLHRWEVYTSIQVKVNFFTKTLHRREVYTSHLSKVLKP